MSRHGRRFFLFGMVGVFNTAIDFALYGVALVFGAAPALANIIAFGGANPISYALNGKVTFRDRAGPARLSWQGYAKFCAAHLLSLAISTGLIYWLAPMIGALAAKLLAIAVTLFINFFASALLVYRPERPRAGEESSAGNAESL